MRPLLGPDSGAPVAVLHVTLPAGGGLPEHDHGPSHVTLIPLHGQVRLLHDGPNTTCGPEPRATSASASVSIPNPGADHAELLVVAAPPDFA